MGAVLVHGSDNACHRDDSRAIHPRTARARTTVATERLK